MTRTGILVSLLAFGVAARSDAQPPTHWAVDMTAGYAGFVDDATKHTFVVGGAVRKYLASRLSVGPELVFFKDHDVIRQYAAMVTGNVTFDARPGPDTQQVTPFIVAGLGWYWARDLFPRGPFVSGDPAFTAGLGVRARVGERLFAVGEYRIGWELHQRLTASVTVELP